jgi:hypothetical protein
MSLLHCILLTQRDRRQTILLPCPFLFLIRIGTAGTCTCLDSPAGRFLFSIRFDRLTACIELFSACKLASGCIAKESEDSSPALSAIGGGAINF